MIYAFLGIAFYWLVAGSTMFVAVVNAPENISNPEFKEQTLFYFVLCMVLGGCFLPAMFLGQFLARKKK